MLEEEHVERSREIQRQTGRTFYFATRFLPQRVRHPTYVLYAFFRISDEIVDDEERSLSPSEQREQLAELRERALGEAQPDDEVMAAFREVKSEYEIPDAEVEKFLDAMETDINKHRYQDFDELRAYMRGSASAVGVMMTAIMEPEDEQEAMPHAVALGEAFQLTNFLRDVREDIVDRDRIYLPQTTLAEHGVDDEQIKQLEPSPGFKKVIKTEIERTEELYWKGVAGIKYLPKDCQLPVLLAAVLYADYHRVIRKYDYDVLTNEPSLSRRRKLSLFARVRLRWAFNKDPEAVFRAVSAIPLPDTHTPESDRSGEPGDPMPAQ